MPLSILLFHRKIFRMPGIQVDNNFNGNGIAQPIIKMYSLSLMSMFVIPMVV